MDESASKTNDSNKIVKKYMIGVAAAGLIPVPVIDSVAITGIQLKMLHSLANLYEIQFMENLGKSLIASLIGSGVAIVGASRLSRALKVVPGVQILAGLSTSAISVAATYAIGKVFIQHFESGGTFLNFKPDQVKAYFAEQFQEGKTTSQTIDYTGIKP